MAIIGNIPYFKTNPHVVIRKPSSHRFPSQAATVDGVLGGFPETSEPDLRESRWEGKLAFVYGVPRKSPNNDDLWNLLNHFPSTNLLFFSGVHSPMVAETWSQGFLGGFTQRKLGWPKAVSGPPLPQPASAGPGHRSGLRRGHRQGREAQREERGGSVCQRYKKWVCLKIVYPYTQWLMIIIPIKWLFHWEY